MVAIVCGLLAAAVVGPWLWWAELRDARRRAGAAARVEPTGVLPDDVECSPISVAPQEIRFLETMRFNRSQIAGLFRVPAHLINDLERATFSNVERTSAPQAAEPVRARPRTCRERWAVHWCEVETPLGVWVSYPIEELAGADYGDLAVRALEAATRDGLDVVNVWVPRRKRRAGR